MSTLSGIPCPRYFHVFVIDCVATFLIERAFCNIPKDATSLSNSPHISIIDFKLEKYFYVTFMAHQNKENVDLETVNS